jgi:predicted  nucleic acid-binding Zn-ribbon protein
MNLKDEIRKLVELQKIDFDIYNHCHQKDIDKPSQLERLKVEAAEKGQELTVLAEKLKQRQLQKKEKELELAAKEDGVKKSQAQLYQLKTNREYQAKLQEIASLKADVSRFEEEVLRAIEEIERAEEKLAAARDNFSRDEKKINEQIAELNAQIKDIALRVKELEDKRTRLSKDVDPNILTRYEGLLQKRSGTAIVPLENDCCGACHMRVTHQKINEIKMYKDLVFCESCVRIIYIPEDLS